MPASSSLFSPQALITYLLTVLLGGSYALIAPTLSLYLSQELGVRPLAVGAFFIGTALCSIVYSHMLGAWSDNLKQRHGLIFAGMCFGGAACWVFAISTSYWLVLLAGLTFFSLSSAVIPQIFAITREYADHCLPYEKTAMFNAIVRSCIAVAWVAAPPLGFFLQAWLGFSLQYSIVGALYVGVGAIAFLCLPRTPKTERPQPKPQLAQTNTGVMLAVVAFVLLFGANHSYVLGLPLLVAQELNAPAHLAGWLMGTAAALEIPVMLITGWLANRLGLVGMIRFGCAAAVGLYAAVWQAESVWQLFALQILNAVFIGCIAGLGITLFQNMLPGRAGAASTVFTNTNQAGNVLGSIFIAVFADLFGYQHLYAVNMLAAMLALVALFLLKKDRSSKPAAHPIPAENAASAPA